MSFETDKQTLEDLNILGKFKNNSIYSIFSGMVTRGGERLLEKMFQHPLTNAEEINQRTRVFRYFKEHALAFPGDPKECDVVEQYLAGASGKHWVFNLALLSRAKILELIGNNTIINQWHKQIITTVFFLQKAKRYLDEASKTINNPMEESIRKGEALLQDKTLACVLNFKVKT